MADETTRLKLRCFSAGAALVLEEAALQSPAADDTGMGVRTLQLDMAPRLDAGGRKFDWDNKCSFQMTAQECVRFTALCHGWVASLEAKYHGMDHNKGLIVRVQGDGSLYFALRMGRLGVAMPVPQSERAVMGFMALQVLHQNHPGLNSASLLASLSHSFGAPGFSAEAR